MGTLEGCSTLVTGGARGIGRAIALRYAREGAKVAIADIDAAGAESVAAEIRSGGGTADGFRADIGEPKESAAMVARVAERFGRLDVLVNNAGVIRVRPLVEMTP